MSIDKAPRWRSRRHLGMGSDSSDSLRLCEPSEAERAEPMESVQKPTRERSSEPNRTEPIQFWPALWIWPELGKFKISKFQNSKFQIVIILAGIMNLARITADHSEPTPSEPFVPLARLGSAQNGTEKVDLSRSIWTFPHPYLSGEFHIYEIYLIGLYPTSIHFV